MALNSIYYVRIHRKIKRDFFTRKKNRRKKIKSSKNIAEFFSMCSRKKGYAETKKMGQLR